MNRYLQMRLANKGKGDFRSEDNTIWIYDTIASDDMEAQWWGGISPSAFISALAKTSAVDRPSASAASRASTATVDPGDGADCGEPPTDPAA